MTPACLTVALSLAGLVLLADAAPSRDRAEELRTRGIELGFNLDHAEAVVAFRAAIAADPDNLAGYRLLAAALWTRALLQQGAVTAGDFIGEAGAVRRALQPDPDLQNAISELQRRAEALVAAERRRGSPDAEASYQIGAAYRLLSSYASTISRDQWRGLGAARHAYREHQRVLTLDPHRKDAALTVGLYRYWVSTLPVWSRLVARIAGLDADREQGVRLVEDAAATAGPFQANALFSLIVIYNQQARYDAAQSVIAKLRQRFPRNRLLWLETGTTALRAGRPAVALDAFERGLEMAGTDPRPRAFGELARWRYHFGVSLARLNQIDRARHELQTALEGEALDWVRGRTHLELGKLAERSADPARAREAFRLAIQLCDTGDDEVCVTESRVLLRRK